MSFQGYRSPVQMDKALRRQVERDIKRRIPGGYRSADDPLPCRECGRDAMPGKVRCAGCAETHRQQQARYREGKRPAGPGRPATTGEWTVGACSGCGKRMNCMKSAKREPCCRNCRRLRSASNPNAQTRQACGACGKSVVTKRSVTDPRCLACRQAQRMAA
jgi:hypothetical protein